MSIIIVNNNGTSGGAVFIEKTRGFAFYNISAKDNLEGNLGILNGYAEIYGANTFSGSAHDNNKMADILISNSTVTFCGNNTFENSVAIYGAIGINMGHVSFAWNKITLEHQEVEESIQYNHPLYSEGILYFTIILDTMVEQYTVREGSLIFMTAS